jgi:hypothetical protein
MTVHSLHRSMQLTTSQHPVAAGFKNVARRLLASLGLEVLKTRTLNAYLSRYAAACFEIESAWRQLAFVDLPERERRVALLGDLQGTGLTEAMWVLEHLHRSLALDGDVCEFGVAQGATSALLANEIRSTSKLLWLFDSFEGLPAPTTQDVLVDDIYGLGSIERYAGRMAEDQSEVLRRLRQAEFPLARARIVPGFIEDTIQQPGLPDRICFAYVDFDFYAPICTALEFVEPRLSAGGYVVVDDYGHFSAGVQTAVDEFIAQRPGQWTLRKPPGFAGQFAILRKAADESAA